MLTKEEEYRLAACIDTVNAEISGKEEFSLNLETILWVATKAKELNDQLKLTKKVKKGSVEKQHCKRSTCSICDIAETREGDER